jgi:hypothetical protein
VLLVCIEGGYVGLTGNARGNRIPHINGRSHTYFIYFGHLSVKSLLTILSENLILSDHLDSAFITAKVLGRGAKVISQDWLRGGGLLDNQAALSRRL